jgi:UDP-glucose-4-epimerase GalE
MAVRAAPRHHGVVCCPIPDIGPLWVAVATVPPGSLEGLTSGLTIPAGEPVTADRMQRTAGDQGWDGQDAPDPRDGTHKPVTGPHVVKDMGTDVAVMDGSGGRERAWRRCSVHSARTMISAATSAITAITRPAAPPRLTPSDCTYAIQRIMTVRPSDPRSSKRLSVGGHTGPVAILVTGGAGYVGSHTARAFSERNADVVVLDSMEFGHRPAVLDATLVEGSVSDRSLVRRVVKEHRIDGVIHFAAYKSPGESMRDPGRYFSNNVCATASLLETLADLGVERFVFSSTCAVYGTPSRLPVDEDHPLAPESPYGQSKYMVEQMLNWYGSQRGLRSVSLRYFNAAGASLDGRIGEDWTTTINLVPLAIKATLLGGSPLQVFGSDYPTPDGTPIRDYVHVVDLADAHVRALDHLAGGEPSTVLNLGTGTGSTVLEVINELERVSGRTVPKTIVGRRPGDPVAIFADNRRASTLLGWRPKYGLEEILATAWGWHSTHLEGYEP